MKRWPIKLLGELCDVRIGRTPRRDEPRFWGGDAIWVTIRELNGGEINSSKEMISEAAVCECMPEPIPTGTLLFSFKLSIGKMAIAGCPLYTNEAIAALPIRKPTKLSRDFLRYALLRESHEGTANTAVMGKVLNKEKVQQLQLPVPPLAEQERIVKLLDEADELRKLRTQADRRSADLIPALFHEMFLKSKFTEKTIGDYLEEGWLLLHKDGNHGSLYPRANDFGDEGVPFLSATCVTDKGAIEHSEVKRLSEGKAKQLRHGWLEHGDVLLAHNATVGKVGYYEGNYDRAIIGTSLTAFRANPERIDSRFLWAALRDEFFQRQLERIMKQALRNQVPITAQRELMLRIPPLPLQQEFAQRVGEIRALQAAQAASRERAEHLFQSMLHRAFSQEL